MFQTTNIFNDSNISISGSLLSPQELLHRWEILRKSCGLRGTPDTNEAQSSKGAARNQEGDDLRHGNHGMISQSCLRLLRCIDR